MNFTLRLRCASAPDGPGRAPVAGATRPWRLWNRPQAPRTPPGPKLARVTWPGQVIQTAVPRGATSKPRRHHPGQTARADRSPGPHGHPAPRRLPRCSGHFRHMGNV